MRKLLLLIVALLAGVSGAWAQITVGPSTGTYWKNGVTPPSDGWAPEWRSNAMTSDLSTPLLVLTSTGGMNANTGDIYSGQTYTLTAPSGYVISSYTFNGTATGGDITFTPSGGSGTLISSGNSLAEALSVTVRAQSTTFTLTGSGYIGSLNLVVTVSPIPVTIAYCPGYVKDNSCDHNLPNYYGSFSGQTYTTLATSGFAGVTLTASSGLTIGGASTVNSSNYGKCFSFATAAASTDYTVTLTAPTGYVITGYYLGCCANTDKALHTLTAADGTSVVVNTPGNNSNSPWPFEVTGINANSTSFTINTASKANTLYVPIFQIYLAKTGEAVSDTYKVMFNGTQVATKTVTRILGSSTAPAIPSSLNKPFCTYEYYSDIACETPLSTLTTSGATIYVKATWTGPFTTSPDFASITNWYFLKLKNQRYATYEAASDPNVTLNQTSPNVDTRWAFVGNPYDGFKIYNKTAGGSVVLASATATSGNTGGNAHTRMVAVDNATYTYNTWTIKESNAISGVTGFYIYNSEGYALNYRANANLAYWTGGTGDGSTFSVEPDNINFAESVAAYSSYFEDANKDKYFGISTSAAAGLQSDYESFSESCTEDQYLTFRDALNSAIRIPATGYYRMKNATGDTYFGVTTGPVGVASNTGAETIVKLTNNGNGTFYLSAQGKYVNIPNVQAGAQLILGDAGGALQYEIPEAGSVIFSYAEGNWTNKSLCLTDGIVKNGLASAEGSRWELSDATTFTGALTNAEDNSGTTRSYATLCVPFNITGITDASAYIPTIDGSYLTMGEGATTIAAGTPLILVGAENAGSYTATIGDTYVTSPVAASGSNALSGTFTSIALDCTAATGTNFVLGFDSDNDDRIGFYHVNNASFPLKANRAYLTIPRVPGVKGYAISFDETSVTSLEDGQTKDNAIFNLAGQRVNKANKGIYIVGGKKVVVK